MDRIDRLESWHAIYDLVCDYMRGQDRLDPVLHRSVFHDDATTDYGDGYRGDADGLVAFAQRVLEELLARDVFIRKPMGAAHDRFIRVSVGPEAELDLFEETLADALSTLRG